jgi:hypothetical protein
MFDKEQAKELTTFIFNQNIKKKEYSNTEVAYDNSNVLVTFSDQMISFHDLHQGQYMHAIIASRFISFCLKTKNEENRYHPFFHAQTFKKLAVGYAESIYENPLLTAKFLPGSDNYRQFSKDFKKHNDKLLAAQKTWTTKSNQLLGYEIKEKENVYVFYFPNKKKIEDINIIYRKKK